MMKKTPGPRAPLFNRRPSLKMTALSYSWMIAICEGELTQTRREETKLTSRKVRPDILYRFYYSSQLTTIFNFEIPIIWFN